jgi:hypothetical protein
MATLAGICCENITGVQNINIDLSCGPNNVSSTFEMLFKTIARFDMLRQAQRPGTSKCGRQATEVRIFRKIILTSLARSSYIAPR